MEVISLLQARALFVPPQKGWFGDRQADVLQALWDLVAMELEAETLRAEGSEESLSKAEILVSDASDMWDLMALELPAIRSHQPAPLWN